MMNLSAVAHAALGLSLSIAVAVAGWGATAKQATTIDDLVDLLEGRIGTEIDIGHLGNHLIVTAQSAPMPSALSAHLRQRMTVDLVDTTIDDAIAFLRATTNLTFVCDPAVLADATPITLQARDMSLGNLLRWIETIGKVHIGYVDGALFVSREAIAGTSRTRVYDVSALVLSVPDFPGPELAYGSDATFSGFVHAR